MNSKEDRIAIIGLMIGVIIVIGILLSYPVEWMLTPNKNKIVKPDKKLNNIVIPIVEIKPKQFSDKELEEIASHTEREGIGMNFYYDELRKRNDAEWAKKELARRLNLTD